MTVAFVTTWLAASVRLAMPVLLAALGEILNERAGTLNVGIEGTMLIGSLAGFLGSFYTGSPWLGALAGVLVGVLAGMVLAWVYIGVQADQVVAGIIFNTLMAGLTSISYRIALGVTTVPPTAAMFTPLHFPLLGDIPILGPVLFRHTILVYLAFLLVPVGGFALFRTKLGLKIRAVGEHPRAADTAGVSVTGIRYLCMAIASAVAGLAGALLVLGQLGVFRDNITAGRGFIALAIVIFGRWNPYSALVAALSFGAADALAMSLQMFDAPIPPQFLLMLPYLLTALVMSGLMTKAVAPAALLQPYTRE
jgi:simple sugar transport system permease protein